MVNPLNYTEYKCNNNNNNNSIPPINPGYYQQIKMISNKALSNNRRTNNSHEFQATSIKLKEAFNNYPTRTFSVDHFNLQEKLMRGLEGQKLAEAHSTEELEGFINNRTTKEGEAIFIDIESGEEGQIKTERRMYIKTDPKQFQGIDLNGCLPDFKIYRCFKERPESQEILPPNMNNTAKKTEETCRSRLFNPTKSFLSILLDDKNQENFCLYREGRNNDGILYQKTKSDRGNKEEYSYNQYKYDHSNSAVTMTHLDGRQLNKNEQKTYSLQNINPNELAEQMSFHQNIEDAIKAARLSAKWEQLKPNSSFESDVKWGFFNGNEAKTHSSLNSALAEFSKFFQSEAFPPIFCHSINLNEGRDQLHVKLQDTPSLIYNISKLDGDLVTLTIDTLNGVRRIVDNEIPEETFVCSLETLATLKAQINQGLINNLVDINDFLNPYLAPTKSEIQQKRFNYDQIVKDYENDLLFENDLPPGFCSFNNYNDLYTIRTHPGDNLTFSLNEKNQIVFKSKEDQPWIVGNLRGKNIKTINKANLPKIIFYLSQNLLEAKKRFGSDENQVLTPMDYLEKIDFTNLTLHNLPEFQNLLKDTRIPHGFCKEIKDETGSFWIIKAGGFFQDKDELLYFQSLKGEKAIACLNPSSNEFEEFTLLDKNNEIVSINDKTIPLLEKIIFERATQQSNLNEGFIPLTLGNFEFIPSNIPSKPNLPSL